MPEDSSLPSTHVLEGSQCSERQRRAGVRAGEMRFQPPHKPLRPLRFSFCDLCVKHQAELFLSNPLSISTLIACPNASNITTNFPPAFPETNPMSPFNGPSITTTSSPFSIESAGKVSIKRPVSIKRTIVSYSLACNSAGLPLWRITQDTPGASRTEVI